VEVTAGEDVEEACCGVAEALCAELPEGVLAWRPLRPVTHVFSHLKAEYRPLLVAAGVRGPAGRKMESSAAEALDCPSRWVAPDRLASLPLPVAQQKILAQALSELGEPALAELALLGVAAQEAR